MARPRQSGKPASARRPEERQRARSAARLAVVQALYQMELGGAGVDSVVEEFRTHRLGRDIEGAEAAEADAPFFADVVRGVVTRQVAIDRQVNAILAEGWRLARLDSTLRALLRAATFELMARDDVPARVVIDEYAAVARAFFDLSETGFVNGALDRIARALRPHEFSPEPDGAV
ncbi:MAG: transcription antitermination factor NusB [Alphaproteobacteria bacterium]